MNAVERAKARARRREARRSKPKDEARPEDAYQPPPRLLPKSHSQREYIAALYSQQLTVALGPAGAGKTYCAGAVAVDALNTGTVSRIVLTRPAVPVEDEEFGHLPGDLLAKFGVWCAPIFAVLQERLGKKSLLQTALKDERIVVKPLAFLQGESFKDDFILLDEAQNCTPRQMKMFLTRLGDASRAAVMGDLGQVMRATTEPSGLAVLASIIRAGQVPGTLVEFNRSDVIRSNLARLSAEAFESRGW